MIIVDNFVNNLQKFFLQLSKNLKYICIMENTKTGKNNFYINRLENWISQFGKEKGLQRGIENLCGLVLSKNFGETPENFFNRKPEILEYKEFINSLKN